MQQYTTIIAEYQIFQTYVRPTSLFLPSLVLDELIEKESKVDMLQNYWSNVLKQDFWIWWWIVGVWRCHKTDYIIALSYLLYWWTSAKKNLNAKSKQFSRPACLSVDSSFVWGVAQIGTRCSQGKMLLRNKRNWQTAGGNTVEQCVCNASAINTKYCEKKYYFARKEELE